MARGAQRGSFRAAVLRNAQQQVTKASNYGHLLLPKGISVFKEEAGGRISLDILPYFVTDKRHSDRDDEFGAAVEGTPWYRRPYKLHRQIGALNVSVVCPATFGKKCPICEYRAKLIAEGSKWDDPSVKALKFSERNLYYVVPKGSSKHEEKPHIWDISGFCFQDKLNEELGENEEFGDFMLLDSGLTLKIRFSEEKMERNSFAKTSRIDFEERKYVYEEKAIRGLTSLDECLDVKDYKEIESLFFENDGEGEETEQPRSGRPVDAEQEDAVDKAESTFTKPKLGAAAPARLRTVETHPPEEDPEPEPERTTTRQRPASSQVKAPDKKSEPKGKCPFGYE
ncbi:MAG: hypothetical protein OK454_07900, partial [Thaumarchaeota archaeon]|nr:hypothetical protein [Nitrososphaerota archaeon]